MTEADLRDIEAVADAATPGPWRLARRVNQRTINGTVTIILSGEAVVKLTEEGTLLHNADTAFVAVARSAVPALVAEVRRLRALVPPAAKGGVP